MVAGTPTPTARLAAGYLDRNQGAARTDENGQPLLQVVVRPDAGAAQRTELATRLIRLSAGPNFQKDMEALITAQLNQLEGSGQHRREAGLRG